MNLKGLRWACALMVMLSLLTGSVRGEPLRLVCKNPSLVSDGKQGALVILTGLPEEKSRELKWTLPSGSVEKLNPVATGVWYTEYVPAKNATGTLEISCNWPGGPVARLALKLIQPLKLKFSKPAVALASPEPVEIRVADVGGEPGELVLKASQGRVERQEAGVWRYFAPPGRYPGKAWFTLHDSIAPERALALEALELLAPREVGVDTEAEARIFIRFGGKEYGPFSNADIKGKLPVAIPPGTERITFIAEDRAGNRREVEKLLKLPPAEDLLITASKNQLPLGGISCAMTVLGFTGAPKSDEYEARAQQGSVTPPKVVGRNLAFTYASPQKGKTGPDVISLLHGGREICSYEIALVAGVLSKTVSKPIDIRKTTDGGSEVTVLLEMTDNSGNPIPDAEFELLNPTGQAYEVFDLEAGKYSFKMKLPPNTDPNSVFELKAAMRPYDLKLARSHILTIEAPESDAVLFMALDPYGLPIGSGNLVLSDANGQQAVVTTNPIGLAEYRLSGAEDLSSFQVSFQGEPARAADVLLAKGAVKKALARSFNYEATAKDIYSVIREQKGDILVSLKGDGGAVGEIVRVPGRLILKPALTRVNADGKTKIALDIALLTKEGIPVEDAVIEVRADSGSVGLVKKIGGGKFSAEYTPPLLAEAATAALEATVAGTTVQTTVKIELLPAPEILNAAAAPATLSITTKTAALEAPATLKFEVKVLRQDGNPVAEGTPVTFSASAGTMAPANAKTGKDGTAAAVFTPPDAGGSLTLSATSGAAKADFKVEVKARFIPIYSLEMPASGKVQFPATLSIEIKVKDQNGVPAPDGVDIALSADRGSVAPATPKTSGGIVKAVFTPEDANYEAQISAEIAGTKGTLRIAVIEAPRVYSIQTPAAVEAVYPALGQLIFPVRDQNGKPAPDGVEVSFSASAGTIASSARTSGGSAAAALTPPEPPATKLSVKVSGLPTSLPADQQLVVPLDVILTAAPNLAVKITASIADKKAEGTLTVKYPREALEIALSASSGSFNPVALKTSGEAVKSTYTPTNQTGETTLRAAWTGGQLCEKSLAIVAGTAKRPSFTLSAFTASACGTDTVDLIAEVRDAFSNFVVDERVDFSVADRQATYQDYLSNGALVKDFARTDSSGQVRVKYKVGTVPGRTLLRAALNRLPNEKFTPETVVLDELPCSPAIDFETSGDGKGRNLDAAVVTAGESLQVFVVSRDSFGRFLNPEAVSFTLTNLTGGVTAANITAASDGRSVTFRPTKLGSATLVASHPSLGSARMSLEVSSAPASTFVLTGPASVTAGASAALILSAFDSFGNPALSYEGSKSVVFSGAGSSGGFQPTAQGTGSSSVFGQPAFITFTKGVGQATLTLYRPETATVHARADSLASDLPPGSGWNVRVLSSQTLGFFRMAFARLAGRLDVHIVVTANDEFGNILSAYDPSSDIVFSLASGTQSGDNIVYTDLPAGGVDNRNGTARIAASSFGTFDKNGQILIGYANTLAEANVIRVVQGSVSNDSPVFRWNPGDIQAIFFLVEPPSVAAENAALPVFSARVVDELGNTVTGDQGRVLTLTVTSGSALFANATAATVNGVATFTGVTYPKAEKVNFAVTAPGLRSTSARTLVVAGGTISSFSVEPQAGSVAAGTPVNFKVTALNAAGTTVNSYTGTAAFSANDAAAALPANTAFAASDQGIRTFAVTFKSAGSRTLTVRDVAAPSATGTSSAVSVSPATSTRLAFVGLPASAVKGSALKSFTAEIRDDFANRTGAGGVITLELAAGTGALGGTLSAAATAGAATFSGITYNTVEKMRLRAMGGGLLSVESGDIEIAAPGLHHFAMDHPFTTVLKGAPLLSAVIKAVDADGAVLENYNGTVRFAASDALAALPADTAFTPFDDGVRVFVNAITFNTLGTQTYTVQDTALSATLTRSEAFSVVATLSKPLLAKAGFLLPAVEELRVIPPRFIPGESSGETAAVHLSGIPAAAIGGSAVLQISTGAALVRLYHQRIADAGLTFTWNGRDNDGRWVAAGVYDVNAVLYDATGRPSYPVHGNVEVDGNIDFGKFGP